MLITLSAEESTRDLKNLNIFFLLENVNIYIGKDTFLPSGYGFPMIKGSPLERQVNKW
jgi:hypothetical protein